MREAYIQVRSIVRKLRYFTTCRFILRFPVENSAVIGAVNKGDCISALQRGAQRCWCLAGARCRPQCSSLRARCSRCRPHLSRLAAHAAGLSVHLSRPQVFISPDSLLTAAGETGLRWRKKGNRTGPTVLRRCEREG